MASSSNYNLDGSIDETFDQYFDQTFDSLAINHGDQEVQKKERKNEFTSKEIVKKVIFVYGMIISVKLRHILKIYSDDDLE